MKKNLISLAVMGALGFSAVTAVADDAFDGAWYGLAGISLLHPDSDFNAESSIGKNIGGFGRIGKEISEHWDAQIGLGYDHANADAAGVTGKYKQTLAGVDALYVFSRENFRPFLLAGLGVAKNEVDYIGAPGGDKTSWMGNLGLGAQYFFGDSWGVQADVREVWSRAKIGNSTDTEGNAYLNLGVIYKFGAKVAAVEPPAPLPEPTPPAAAEEPAAEPVGPAEPAFEKVTLASEVLFAFDKDVLKEEGKAKLDSEVVEKLKAHPEVELVLITGHTDRIGDSGYNQKLSERRANVVKKYLISQGIEAGRLHAVGKGEAEPVVDCKGVHGKKAIECLQPNRRVVVEIEVQRAGN